MYNEQVEMPNENGKPTHNVKEDDNESRIIDYHPKIVDK